MEKVKKETSIQRDFIFSVAVTMLIVVVLSGITIFDCYRIKKYLLPDSQEIWLHTQTVMADGTISEAKQRVTLNEPVQISFLTPSNNDREHTLDDTKFIIEKIESSFAALTQKKQFLYRGLSILMVALPLLYSFMGIGICAWWFYRKKLAPPIKILSDAAGYIREQDLDFTIQYESTDEFGRLCTAFEEMRQALYDNNRQLWNMIEERKVLQASVAHDLRNPIAIIEGYVDYAKQCLDGGILTKEKLEHILSNLAAASKRLEHYTDDIRDLHSIEKTEVKYAKVRLTDLLRSATENFAFVAKQKGCVVEYHSTFSSCEVKLDEQIFYRVTENVFSNALRYAESKIIFRYALADDFLNITITDDGKGFSKTMLQKQNTYFYSEDTTGKHMGLGLATSRVLCQKHGGSMMISNTEHGACVTITLRVKMAI